MIQEIQLANVGAYDAAGTKLEGLKKLNFIFGSNGSGKTTISRVIEGMEVLGNCKLSWAGGSPLDMLVYNKDFVAKHFDATSSMKGVYTFGETGEIAKKIETLKDEVNGINTKLVGLRKNLSGDDGNSGKTKELKTLEAQFVDDVWAAMKKFNGLDAAFTGLKGNKKKFCERYLSEASTNGAQERDVSELREEATTVFSSSLTKLNFLPDQDSSKTSTLEKSTILTKNIIGKQDVDIAALIERVGNSDWVQQGRQYFTQLDDQCPYCQQKTDMDFKNSLEAYFDESYVADLAIIDKLLTDYSDAARDLIDAYNASDIIESPYLDRVSFEKDIKTLSLALDKNIEQINSKRKQPSALTTLIDTAPLVAVLSAQISAANNKIRTNNDISDNLALRKRDLVSQIWKRLLQDTKEIYRKFKLETDGLDKAVRSLEGQIQADTQLLTLKQEEIEENERKITSIKPTIVAINKLLKSFGFKNFYLVESGSKGFYEVKRADDSDAKKTLSEGEKSFITFLYFYHLIGGSFSSSGGTRDKVVVFDDPVSSLDSDILFIVCNLIRKVSAEMISGNSKIKQIFILTHNIYFHKEVTFEKGPKEKNKSDKTFWIVRKTSQGSKLELHGDNPIKSSYELLWREVRQRPPSDTAIQNVMRRILEHYFKFYGGIEPEKIIEKFDHQDKMICNTLLSWVNDGSHFAIDDLHMACDQGQIDRYLNVFQRIFVDSNHGEHYKMMMGDDYLALPDT